MTRFQHMAISAITALTALATVTSATFTDQADIQAVEAVEVLSAIEIMVGDEAGTFRPNDAVTRAEMAKMVVHLVGETAEGGSDFTDCQDSWANGYIATAVSSGFVAGDGDGTFRPNGTVTGLEAAKMLLVALGHDNGDYVGATWSDAVLADCQAIGLGDDLDLTAELTRQETATMLLTALEATVVDGDATLCNVYFPDLTKDGDTWLLDGVTISPAPEAEEEEETEEDEIEEEEEVVTTETDDLLFTDGVITGSTKIDGETYYVYQCYLNGKLYNEIKSKNDYNGQPQFYGGSYTDGGDFVIETLEKDETGAGEEVAHDTNLLISTIVNNRWIGFSSGGGVFFNGSTEFDASSVVIYDLTDNGLTSVKKLAAAMEEGGLITVSVVANSDNGTVSYIYITDYSEAQIRG